MALVIGSGITIGGNIGVAVVPTITIATQPSSVTAYAGSTATFTTSATATLGAVVSYQWAKLESTGGSWANIVGATSSSYTTGTLTVASDNGDQYRCVVSATRGAVSVNTNTATLTVQQAVITIDSQPSNQSVADGTLFTFTVFASVTLSATLSYQWYIYSGGTWNELVGATSNSYGDVGYTNMNGNQYRVIVSATKGATPVTSNTATLTIVVDNTMTVAFYYNGNSLYGASKGNRQTQFGTLTSSYFEAIYTVFTDFITNTVVFLTQGVYPGFYVGYYGNIDDDQASYPRIFTINGQDYTFVWDQTSYAYIRNGAIGLQNISGSTIPVVYTPYTPSLTPNTIITSSWTGYNNTLYGASTGLSNNGGPSGIATFGTVVSNYLLAVVSSYNGTSWVSSIELQNGSYSGFQVSNGYISGDSAGSTRIFTIGGTNYTFIAGQPSGTGVDATYEYNGEITGLTTDGSVIPAIYDPNAQGGGAGGNTSVGTITVGQMYSDYGWKPSMVGSGNFSPAIVYWLYFDGSMTTNVQFLSGTYGSVVITSSTIDGESQVTVTVGNITETGNLMGGGGPGPYVSFSGDIFNLQSQLYQTLPVEILAGSGGGGGTTYTGGVDYQNTVQTQPGIYFQNMSGSDVVFVYPPAWTTPAGATALLALTSGSTFTAVTTPAGGGAPISVTVTLTSTWSGAGGASVANITTSLPISTDYPNFVPASVTLAGGGGGGSESFTQAGNWISASWMNSGPAGRIQLDLDANPQASFLAALNAVTDSSATQIDISQSGEPATTVTVVHVSGFPIPFVGGSTVLFYTDIAPPGGMSWPNIASMTFASGGSVTTVISVVSGYWDYWGSIQFDVLQSHTSDIAILDSLAPNSSITITDPSSAPTTATVTISGTLAKTPSPDGPFIRYSGSTTTTSPNPSYYQNLTSVTVTTDGGGGGGGGGGSSISNISNLFFDGYAAPQSLTYFSFSTQPQRDAAYNLLNAPGTWNCVGNYMSPNYDAGNPMHGSFQLAIMGPSSTDDNGPPSFMYRVITPSSINNAVSDGPATGGPFSASK